MKRIYVAGPYSSDNIITILSNIRQGIEVSAQLVGMGYAVFCPFLDFLYALTTTGPKLTKEQFQQNSLAWVEVSDAVLLLPGWRSSNGTKREIERAIHLGIKVTENIEDMEILNERLCKNGG